MNLPRSSFTGCLLCTLLLDLLSTYLPRTTTYLHAQITWTNPPSVLLSATTWVCQSITKVESEKAWYLRQFLRDVVVFHKYSGSAARHAVVWGGIRVSWFATSNLPGFCPIFRFLGVGQLVCKESTLAIKSSLFGEVFQDSFYFSVVTSSVEDRKCYVFQQMSQFMQFCYLLGRVQICKKLSIERWLYSFL
jgi:hypothetical protein